MGKTPLRWVPFRGMPLPDSFHGLELLHVKQWEKMSKNNTATLKKAPNTAWAPPGVTHADMIMAVALLPQLVEAFLLSKVGMDGWTPTRLGKVAVGDAHKIFEMREGTALRPATAQRVLNTIEDAAPGFAKKFVRAHMRGAKQ